MRINNMNIPTWWWILLAVSIIVSIVFILIPSITPSNKYGHKPKQVRQKTVGFFKHNNPTKIWHPLFRWLSKLSMPKFKKKSVTKQKEVVINDVPEVTDSEMIQPEYFYDDSCQDWQIGDKYLGNYVSFVCTPYRDENKKWWLIFSDPFIKEEKKRKARSAEYSYFSTRH